MVGDWLNELLDDAISFVAALSEAEREILLETCTEAAVIQKSVRRSIAPASGDHSDRVDHQNSKQSAEI
mgnify:FL=1